MTTAATERTLPKDIVLSDPALLKSFAYIANRWTAAADGTTITVTDPADGAPIGEVARLSAEESARAVDSADAAFPGWANSLPQDRARLLHQWFDLIVANREDLARIMTAEQGKPISEARGEIDYAASFVEFYAEETWRPNIESVTSDLKDAEVQLWREPVGVAALITPWNFPSAMLTRKAAAVLAAGCTIVAHPSHETPFSALALAELADRTGFPAGVFNVVSGHAATVVPPWTRDPRVRAVSFTGSTPVGQLPYRESAQTVTRLVLELGGHAPFLMFADAGMERGVDEGIKAKFATSGPIGAAAGVANLQLIDEMGLVANAKSTGAYFNRRLHAALAGHPMVGEVRGEGLLAAVEFVADKAERRFLEPAGQFAGKVAGGKVAGALVKRGVIARAMPQGDIIGFAPPLCLTEAEADIIVEAVTETVAEVLG